MYTSQQVSQMLNNQNAQFANQQAFASNISSTMGFMAPPIQTLGFNYGGLHDPYGTQSAADFGTMGAGAISGVTQNMPGMITNMAMGAGLLSMVGVGGKLTRGMSYLDPMTSAFSMGISGAKAGAGISQSTNFFRAAGQAFMSGPGTLGKFAMGGLTAAAVPLAIGAGVMKGAEFIGQNISMGAQQDAAIHNTLRANFDFYNPQARSGRGFSVQQRDQISDSLRGIAEADPFTEMGELSRILTKAAKGNLMHGATTAREFGQKFKQLTDTLKETAKILGTSMEGAMSFFDASKSMGFYNKVDILRNAQNALVGAGGGLTSRGIMQEQAMGAAQARAMGYTGAQGAILARKSVQSARDMFQGGMTSEADLGEMTGGLRGEEAYKNLGRQMQGAAYSLAQSGIGRAVYAALAETTGEGSNRRFTGKLDTNLLKQFRAGSLTASDVRRMASTKLANASTDTKLSFLNMEKDIAGSFAAGAGGEGWMGIINMVREQKPNLSDEKVKLLLKNMTGLGRRQIEYIMKMYEKQDDINQKNAERATNLLRRRMEENELKMNHTFEGLMTQVGHAVGQWTSQPLQRLGSNMSRGLRDFGRGIYDSLFGRKRTASIGSDVLSSYRDMMIGGQAGTLASERYKTAMQAVSGGLGSLDMSTGIVPRLLGTGGMQKVLADMGGIESFALQGKGGDINDRVTLSRAGLGSVMSDNYSQKRLAFIQKTLADSSRQADGFFKDHEDSMKAVSESIAGLTAKQLFKLSDTGAGWGTSARANRRDALSSMLANDSKRGHHFRNLTDKYARTLASRQGLDYDRLSRDERAGLQSLAQESILSHSMDKKNLVRQIMGESEYQGMLDGDVVMTGQKLADKRLALEKEFASSLTSATGFFDNNLGLKGQITRALGDTEQRADLLSMLRDGDKGIGKVLGKYGAKSDMTSIGRSLTRMSAADRLKMYDKAMKGMEAIRFAEGGHVLAGQFQRMGKELSDVSTGALSDAIGADGGSSFDRLRKLLTGSNLGNIMENQRGIVDEQANLARSLSGLSGRKLADARKLLGGSEVGRAALVNRRLYTKDMTSRLQDISMTTTDDEFIDKLKSLGFGGAVSSESGRKRLLAARDSGNVEAIQKALLVSGVGKKEDALQVLTLMRGGVEKMATTAEKLLDVMLTVHSSNKEIGAMKAKWDGSKSKTLWDNKGTTATPPHKKDK